MGPTGGSGKGSMNSRPCFPGIRAVGWRDSPPTGPRETCLSRLPRKSSRCYTFAASQGGFLPTSSTFPSHRVSNSVAAGRRLAQRAIAWQAVATVLVALAFLVKGLPWSLAALVGGGAVTLAARVAAMVALGGGVSPAGTAFARLLVGMALKWLLVLVTVVVALAVFRLPGIPLLAGVIAATLALVLANSIRR